MGEIYSWETPPTSKISMATLDVNQGFAPSSKYIGHWSPVNLKGIDDTLKKDINKNDLCRNLTETNLCLNIKKYKTYKTLKY